MLRIHYVSFVIELRCYVAELPLRLYIFGAVGNVATFFGALAE